MATTTTSTSTLNIEFSDVAGGTVLTWRINDPVANLTRAQVESAISYLFASYAGSLSGLDLLYNPATGSVATGLGKIETVDTVVTKTDLV